MSEERGLPSGAASKAPRPNRPASAVGGATGGGDVKGFEQAKQELERILSEFDHDQVHLDNLVPKLKRAKELIDFCTKRIKQIDAEAKEIVKSIEPREASRGEAAASDDEEPPF